MINKKFENKDNGDTVTIRQDDGVWFTLTNGAKIKKDSFFGKYTELVDPDNFFNNQGEISSLADQLNKMDTREVMDNTNEQQRTVRQINDNNPISPPNIDQKQHMIDEYTRAQKLKQQELNQYQQVNDDEASAKQLLGEQQPIVQHTKPPKNNPNYPEFNPNTKKDRDSSSTDYYNENLHNQPVATPPSDPTEDSYKFFKGFKKNHKITIELNFEEYIADPLFLKLMMDNFEADVIKFYTMEIFKNVINNPQKVEEDIYTQLEDIILNNKTTKENRVIPKVPKEDRVQIGEGVPELKKKNTEPETLLPEDDTNTKRDIQNQTE